MEQRPLQIPTTFQDLLCYLNIRSAGLQNLADYFVAIVAMMNKRKGRMTMAIDDKKCIVCNKHHKYCVNDPRYDKNETWRNLYCSEECREVFDVYNEFKHGLIKAEEASRRIKKINYDGLDKINEPMRSVLVSVTRESVSTEKQAKPKTTIKKRGSKARTISE